MRKLIAIVSAFTLFLGIIGMDSNNIVNGQIINTLNDVTDNATIEAISITNSQELLDIAKDTSGSYILKNDIDMTGIDWIPIDFTGTLDGNGYAILNLTVKGINTKAETTYDGNYKTYETFFSGLFGVISNATIKNLSLINERIALDSDVPTFIGSIAGYEEDSTISNCNISSTLVLKAASACSGIGGIIGYGNGVIEDTQVDVIMTHVDKDSENRDEQFMGGACGAGYPNIKKVNVNIDGYISEHGYVHSGGVIGMYILYPTVDNKKTEISETVVEGRITFFENNMGDSSKERAYCEAFVGETLQWKYDVWGNAQSFNKNRVYTFDKDLYPEVCEKPDYTSEAVAPTCSEYGYTLYTCKTCGYSYKDNYTVKTHEAADMVITLEPTYKDYGIMTGKCKLCGVELTKTVDKLIKIDKMDINCSEKVLKQEEELQLKVSITPENASIKTKKWTTNNEEVATVSEDGLVTAVGAGEAVITYTVNGEQTIICKVTINKDYTIMILIGAAVVILVIVSFVCKTMLNKKRRSITKSSRSR